MRVVLEYLLFACLAWICSGFGLIYGPVGVAVVRSGTMEPFIHRGDLVIITGWNTSVSVNDVVAYKLQNQSVPIVHRIESMVGNNKIVTKGDANRFNDVAIYQDFEPGRRYLERKHILGVMHFKIPFAGYLALFVQESKIATTARHLLCSILVCS